MISYYIKITFKTYKTYRIEQTYPTTGRHLVRTVEAQETEGVQRQTAPPIGTEA